MKKLMPVLLLLAVHYAEAQKNIDGLIHAEQSFAAWSVQHGTKDAFLKFLDSNGMVFERGEAVNGRQVWNKKEDRPGILDWRPEFVEIASCNEFGYTTGPWEFKQTPDDTALARGQFTTVWHVDQNGEWKFLVDLGTGNRTKMSGAGLTRISADKQVAATSSTDEVLAAERDFTALYRSDKRKAYERFLSAKSILNRNSNNPAVDQQHQDLVIEQTPSDIEFTVSGAGMAASGDLAYVYGKTRNGNRNENFLHIWRREKQGWKLALEVLRY